MNGGTRHEWSTLAAGGRGTASINNRSMMFAVILLAISSFAYADITAGLVGYWKFDENTGIIAADSSGNGLDANLVNSPTWTAGYTNSDLNFNSSGFNRVLMPLSSTLDISTNITVSFWINIRQITESNPLEKGMSSSNGYTFWLGNNGGVTGIHWGKQGTASWASTTSTPNLNEWIHVAGTYDGAVLKLYINGAFDKNYSVVTSFTNTDNLSIARGLDGYFNGKIDQLRIYNRTLTAGDINQLYYCQPPTIAGRDWVIDGNTSCSLDSSMITNVTIGNNLDIKKGQLNIPNGSTLRLATGKKILVRKNPLNNNKIWLRKGGQIKIRK